MRQSLFKTGIDFSDADERRDTEKVKKKRLPVAMPYSFAQLIFPAYERDKCLATSHSLQFNFIF